MPDSTMYVHLIVMHFTQTLHIYFPNCQKAVAQSTRMLSAECLLFKNISLVQNKRMSGECQASLTRTEQNSRALPKPQDLQTTFTEEHCRKKKKRHIYRCVSHPETPLFILCEGRNKNCEDISELFSLLCLQI